MTGMVIAIDGPSGTGKSTVSRKVAAALGMSYFDTGATYRATVVACQREAVSLSRADDVVAVIETMNLELVLDPVAPRVFLDGDEISAAIRKDDVALRVSEVSTNLDARAALGAWQRQLIARERTGGHSAGAGVVVEGRDITTVIAPDADARILMTADAEVRVARRAGEGADVATVRDAVLGRDARDSAAVNVTTAADGVITLDTTHLTIEQAVDAVLLIVHEAAL